MVQPSCRSGCACSARALGKSHATNLRLGPGYTAKSTINRSAAARIRILASPTVRSRFSIRCCAPYSTANVNTLSWTRPLASASWASIPAITHFSKSKTMVVIRPQSSSVEAFIESYGLREPLYVAEQPELPRDMRH